VPQRVFATTSYCLSTRRDSLLTDAKIGGHLEVAGVICLTAALGNPITSIDKRICLLAG